MLWPYGVKALVGHHENVENWSTELKRAKMMSPGELELVEDQAPSGEDPGYESGVTEIQRPSGARGDPAKSRGFRA